MRKRILLSLLGAGLIYTGCGEGELNSDSSSCGKPDAISIQQDAAVDTYDTGIDTHKVKADTYLDTTADTAKDTLGLETKVSTDAVGDTEEETNADVYQITLCPDLDKDGFFGTISGEDCYAPSGKDGDCNDKNKLIYPGAVELCDKLDNDCNGLTDEEIPTQSYYTGLAGTLGVGTCTGGIKSCVNGTLKITTPEVTPAAKEFCDGKDNNCNGFTDEGLTNKIYYEDADGDENGNLYSSIIACSAPVGYVTNHNDCDDTNKLIYLDANETCNGKDDDCDGEIDNGATPVKYFFDGDSDGYGDKNGEATESCVALPPGYVTNNTDCNDQNKNINPNVLEVCNNIDDNCNGSTDEGLEEMVACGKNGNGTQKKSCVNGKYVIDPNCDDPDECIKDEEKLCLSGDGLMKCNIEDGIYKFIPIESEDTGKFPDGKDNNCNGQIDEIYFVLVPAGTYVAGCDYPFECGYAGNPTHSVNTAGFYIAKYETTNKQYQKCVDAGKCTAIAPIGEDDYPRLNITKAQAEDYCMYADGRISTADEWEIAAKGGKAENNYPWGILLPDCNWTNSWYCETGALEVGSKPLDQSTFGTGIFDMGGNVSEWTSTSKGDVAFVKGGNWKDGPEYCLVYYEQFKAPAEPYSTVGFRCVRDEVK